MYHLLLHSSLFICVLRVFFSSIFVMSFLHFLNFRSYYALRFESLVFLSPIIIGFVQVPTLQPLRAQLQHTNLPTFCSFLFFAQ
jgi:hypothetical protein